MAMQASDVVFHVDTAGPWVFKLERTPGGGGGGKRQWGEWGAELLIIRLI